MDNNSLEKLHRVELETLERFVTLCNNYSLQYFIIGGTLIGAVRHGGFIPWDDDIDIAMPRADYNRLINIMHCEEDEILGMEYYKDDPELYFYPIRITNKKYTIKEPRTKGGYAHPWMDVLPIDGMPDGKIKRLVFRAKMDSYRLLLGLHYVDNLRNIERSKMQRIIITFGKITKVGKLVNPTIIKDKISKTLSANNMGDSELSGTCMGAYYFHEFTKTEFFGAGTDIMFEGLTVRAPEKIDEYLTHMYGNYMELPPVEKRISHMVEFV